MPTPEHSPEGGFNNKPPADGQLPEPSETPQDYERKRQERRRQEVLNYLIDNGRAKTPEEAERYLESLTHLKERLTLLVRDLILKTIGRNQTHSWMQTNLPRVAEVQADGTLREVREPIEAALRPEDLDRSDPRVWSLSITLAPAIHGSGMSVRGESLLLPMVNRAIAVQPNEYNLAEYLSANLSQEQLQSLIREYDFSYQQLVENLRGRADELADSRMPIGLWEPLFDPEKPAGG